VTLLQYKHKDYGDDLLESEKNNNELDLNFEEEDSELEFNYEPGIALASLATCACPCLPHTKPNLRCSALSHIVNLLLVPLLPLHLLLLPIKSLSAFLI